MTTEKEKHGDKATPAGSGYCPTCGAAATWDLAPNPGPTAGGPPAPPVPPPEGVNLPPAPDPVAPGAWHLVVCSTHAHRTLWPEGKLDELASPPAREGTKPRAAHAGPEAVHGSQAQAHAHQAKK